MIMSTYAMLKENPQPSEEEARLSLSGNLCRCTGYNSIIKAVLEAAEEARKRGIKW
ncbi:MAG: 2Fe-2S iron-sulfur cluster-binding protein, partial [Bacilli bacterium]